MTVAASPGRPGVTARHRPGGGWRPALRMGWRDACRHKVRTALIVALIAIPVLGMTYVVLGYRTEQLTRSERATQVMGRADGIVSVSDSDRIEPPDPSYVSNNGVAGYSSAGAAGRSPLTVHLPALFPAGTAFARVPAEAPVQITTGAGARTTTARDGGLPVSGSGRSTDDLTTGERATDALATGVSRLVDGRRPRSGAEVAVSRALRDELRLRLGDRIELRPARNTGAPLPAGSTTPIAATVVGVAVERSSLDSELLYAGPGLVPAVERATPAADRPDPANSWLVRLPAGADPLTLWHSLAGKGVAFVPRAAFLDPAAYHVPTSTRQMSASELGAFGVVLGFGLIEVVLLAGTAFAVGAKRQVHDLGLVAATGGTRRDVRHVVLAGGLVLGVLGAVIGVAGGFIAIAATWGRLEGLAGHEFGGLVAPPVQVIGVAAFGLVAGCLAAIVPAVTASRLPVIEALAGRFVPRRQAYRSPLAGAFLIAAGCAVAFLSAVRARVVAPGSGPLTGAVRLYVLAAVAGLALVTIGVALVAPALVAGLARIAHRFPLTMRLAARDAGRHRHRTAPAIAAVTLAVAGSIAIGFVVTGTDKKDRDHYVAMAPTGSSSVYLQPDTDAATRARVLRDVAATVGATEPPVPVRSGLGRIVAGVPAEQAQQPVEFRSPLCAGRSPDGCGGPGLVGMGQTGIADAALLQLLLGGRIDPAVRRTLADGGVVFLGSARAPIEHGRTIMADSGPRAAARYRSMPAVAVPGRNYDGLPSMLVGAATAHRLGLVADSSLTLLPSRHVPTSAEQNKANQLLQPIGGSLAVERGFQAHTGVIIAILGGASGMVTVAGVAIAVGLAAAEGRADLEILAAVGADPRRRRRLALAQAAVVGGVGCALGLGFGAFIGSVMLSGFRLASWAVPWDLLAAVGVGVPLLAMIVAGTFTRSRLPTMRRPA